MRAVLNPDGRLIADDRAMRASVGRGGMIARKAEGDGGTPMGLLPLRRVLYRADRIAPPRCAVPIEPIAPDDAWCDDSGDGQYNRMVRLPFAARHEALWRADGLYDLIGVLGWNDRPVIRGAGSAIFLHVARPDGGSTDGCVALPLPDLLWLLAWPLTELGVG